MLVKLSFPYLSILVTEQEVALDREQFLMAERVSRDTIDVKRVYIRMAGSIPGGVLLSQIVYWHLPSNSGGRTKLRVEHKGELWLAKRRTDWWNEICMTPDQFDVASKALEDRGLIVSALFKFDGAPTKHLRINWPVFLASYVQESKLMVEEQSSDEGPVVQAASPPSSNPAGLQFSSEAEVLSYADTIRARQQPTLDALTTSAREYFSQFRRRRWATKAQEDLWSRTEKEVGEPAMLAAVAWAATAGISNGVVQKICSAAKKIASEGARGANYSSANHDGVVAVSPGHVGRRV